MTEGMIGPLKRRAKATATARPSVRRKVAGLVVVIGAIALLAVALVPASNSTDAYPTREGGCGCHSYRTTPFLTVNGLPSGTYTPGLQYSVDVIVADPNGLTGENAFSFRITSPAVGGGTLATTDPNVEINTAIEASANDAVTPMTATQWTVLWTAPASGSVTINITSVMNQTSIIGTPPYDRYTVTLTEGAAIPEFPALLIPVVGIGLAVVVAAKVTRKSK
jgi:hypothetical protein